MDWPPLSLNRNPTENLWGVLENFMQLFDPGDNVMATLDRNKGEGLAFAY